MDHIYMRSSFVFPEERETYHYIIWEDGVAVSWVMSDSGKCVSTSRLRPGWSLESALHWCHGGMALRYGV